MTKKSILYYLSLLFMVVIPLIIFYIYYDVIAEKSAENLINKLNEFLNEIRFGIESEGVDIMLFIKYIFWGYVIMYVVDKKFMQNRLTGLSLMDRRADWLLNIWFIVKILGMWTVVYSLVIYLGLNTDSLFEHVNLALYSILVGVATKVISTYQYSVTKL